MVSQPLVEAVEQRGAVVAVVQLEVHRLCVAIGRAEHVHHALPATVQADAVELAALGGLDVQRYQPQPWPIVRMRFELGALQRALTVVVATEQHRRGDEALHQVAFRWADIGFEDLDAGLAQASLQRHQLPVLLAIQAHDRTLLKVAQLQRAQLRARLVGQQRASMGGLLGRHEGHRGLRRQTHSARPLVGGQPELHAGALGRVVPMAGQDEPLLQRHSHLEIVIRSASLTALRHYRDLYAHRPDRWAVVKNSSKSTSSPLPHHDKS